VNGFAGRVILRLASHAKFDNHGSGLKGFSMDIRVTVENAAAETAPSGPVVVGWFYNDQGNSIVFDPPTRVRSVEMNKTHAKSASRCPAVINMESRYFEIKCPFDLHLQYTLDPEGKPSLRNMLGERSPVRPKKLREHVHLIDKVEWRYPERPTVQLSLPYVFISDEPVYLQQVAPFMHYNPQPFPGTIFGGRFPVNVWPRPLQWAFEWHDTQKPLIMKRGDPLFYVTFETIPQERAIQVVEAEVTPELKAYCDMISGAVNYVNQTFSLFKAAEERRPAKLVKALERR
jgi:hypothetical protein